ncbi:MAG: glycosyltransferase [Spartobacteria bacterium]|nr:glycosyltransferase [Spartobacteria bacterium]
MKNKKKVSVVLSFRNEADVIPELIRRLRDMFTGIEYDYELVFVNDASNDQSLQVLMKHREADPNIKIINMARRFGITPCVLAGFHEATGDAIVYMDCDLQDPPEVIPAMIKNWEEGTDVVHTTRTIRRGENAFKMWLTDKAYQIINLMANIDIPRNTGDFKLVSRRAANELLRMDEFDPFMRGLVVWIGFKQERIFYEREARFAGKTKFSLWSSINPYQEFLRGLTRFSNLPLYLGLVAGGVVSSCSLLFLAVLLLRRLAFGAPLSGSAANLAATLFLGGAILFTVGILGVYIGIIHKEVQRRPHYIIESRIGMDTSAE